MAYLNDFINDIIEKTIIAPASKAAEIAELTDVIDKEKSGIEDDYSKIGKLYVEKYAKANDDTDLGLLVDGVKAREKKIKDSKLRIGEQRLTRMRCTATTAAPRCLSSCCPAWFFARTATRRSERVSVSAPTAAVP